MNKMFIKVIYLIYFALTAYFCCAFMHDNVNITGIFADYPLVTLLWAGAMALMVEYCIKQFKSYQWFYSLIPLITFICFLVPYNDNYIFQFIHSGILTIMAVITLALYALDKPENLRIILIFVPIIIFFICLDYSINLKSEIILCLLFSIISLPYIFKQ